MAVDGTEGVLAPHAARPDSRAHFELDHGRRLRHTGPQVSDYPAPFVGPSEEVRHPPELVEHCLLEEDRAPAPLRGATCIHLAEPQLGHNLVQLLGRAVPRSMSHPDPCTAT